MARNNWLLVVGLLGLSACASRNSQLDTIADLKPRQFDLQEPKTDVVVEPGKVREYYREFLAVTNENKMYSEALRRLADIELKSGEQNIGSGEKTEEDGQKQALAAIKLYQTYLKTYPHDAANDLILYQLAKAYEITGQNQLALTTFDKIIEQYPKTRYRDEVQFRRGEMLFLLKRYEDSELAYASIINNNKTSIFYEKALYKYGWAQFKQNRFKPALNAFFAIMDRKQQQGLIKYNKTMPDLAGSERDLLDDTLRAISLCFAYANTDYTINQYFTETGERPYEPLIFSSLGKLHLEKDRIKDAADTFMAFVKRHPTSELAPEFHTEAIKTYQKANLMSLVIPAKEEFVRLYGVGSAYWEMQNETAREQIRPLLATHIVELASYYHAQARSSKLPADFAHAADIYSLYLKNLPNDKNAAQMNFLMGEALFDGKFYSRAVAEFEKTAYDYPPHPKNAEAGYAALLAYAELEKTTPAAEFNSVWRQKSISSALRFADQFPTDKRAVAVLTKTAEQLFALNDYLRASATAQKALKANNTDPALKRTALVVLGHSQFELKNYAQAQQAYRESLNYFVPTEKQYAEIYDRLAASIYKQAELARDKGDLQSALALFASVKAITPASSLRANADYDAATTLITIKDYKKAAILLENFRKEFPNHALAITVPEKLAFIYSETGQTTRAATEMERLAQLNKNNPEYSRNLLWQAAGYYDKGKLYEDAKRVYSQYLQQFPAPLEPAVEARHNLAEIARKNGDTREWGRWLQDIIQTDAAAGAQRTDRTHFLAADATLLLAQGYFTAYKQAKLTNPLKESLARKKDLMQTTIKAYEGVLQFHVAAVTTSATYQIAEIYADFAQSLLNSERPQNLNAEELQQYNTLLEEQAFPFEEKAIAIHVDNLQQIRNGIYDDWVKRSLAQLRKLQPARYGKIERVNPYVDAIN
ncbi:MAG: tetratricopeptide repeat protein [Gammaproteobacteria bacterium]|nr:tetratricopeptide repeat protein [Gammaproteobacteria bacterium]